jgi:hypothetical protein
VRYSGNEVIWNLRGYGRKEFWKLLILVVMVCILEVKVCSLVVKICSLVVMVCSLVVKVCSLVVMVCILVLKNSVVRDSSCEAFWS